MNRPALVILLAVSGAAGAGVSVAATAKPPHPPPGKPPPKTTTTTVVRTTTVANTTTVVHTTTGPGSTVTRGGGGGGGGGPSGSSGGGGETKTVTQLVTVRVPTGRGISPGPATIRVTLREIRSKASTADRRTTHVYLILNRPAYTRPIGRAVMICNQADARLFACRAYFSLSRGQLMMGGLVTTFRFFRLAVLGGTGFYDTTGGSAIIQQIGSDAWSVVIGLEGL